MSSKKNPPVNEWTRNIEERKGGRRGDEGQRGEGGKGREAEITRLSPAERDFLRALLLVLPPVRPYED